MPLHSKPVSVAIAAAIAAVTLAATTSEKVPYHTSSLSGEDWIRELLTGHEDRIQHELGVHREVFTALVQVLRSMGYRDSRDVILEEQVGIFLYTCRTALSVRHVGERFQRANATIAK